MEFWVVGNEGLLGCWKRGRRCRTLNTTNSWVVGNEGRDVELRRRWTLGLLETREAMMSNCQKGDLLIVGKTRDTKLNCEEGNLGG